MKKKFLVVLYLLMIMIGVSGTVNAAPMYYTFKGFVSGITSYNAKIIENAGLIEGSPVTYTFLVDFGAGGTWTGIDGKKHIKSDDDANGLDFFYADYISGSALKAEEEGTHPYDSSATSTEWAAENNIGLDYSYYDYEENVVYEEGSLWGNSDDDSILIGFDWLLTGHLYTSSSLVSDWVVGTEVPAINHAYASDGTFSELSANLTLTKISPVPEPATMLLLGSGLIGLAGIRKRFKKS